jgi:hypothetical protein
MRYSLKAQVNFQYAVGRCVIFFAAPLVYLIMLCLRYRIRNLKEIRCQVKRMYRKHKGPWLICANHLTLVDSVIIAYALAPFYVYMIHYKMLPWNIPEKTNFNRNLFISMLTFVVKCVPVVRGGDRGEVGDSLSKCGYLLSKKESLLIFPEGTRSRSGRIDPESFSYGPGRLFVNAPDCRVLCVYLRGDRQKTFSAFPETNQDFTMAVKSFVPQPSGKGLRAQRDAAKQIIDTLVDMEKKHVRLPGK